MKGNLSLSPLTFLHLKFIPPSQDSRPFSIFNAKAIENGVRGRKGLAFFPNQRADALLGVKYVGLVCSFLFFLCINFSRGERGAAGEPPQQRVVFPYRKRKKFYPVPEMANSPISKSKAACKFECSFSQGDLMLASIDSVYICSLIHICFFKYQYFELYDTLCYAVNFVLIVFL